MARLFILFVWVVLSVGSVCLAASTDQSIKQGVSTGDSAAVKTESKDVISKIRTQGVLTDQNEESLFEEVAPVPVASPATVRPDTSVKATETPAAAGIAVDTIGSTVNQSSGTAATASESSAPVATEDILPAGPIRVDSVRSINFARNLKEYKSPRIAMLLSLILPGAGQAYAKEYLWSAVFGVVEAGIIATSVGLNIKGQNQRKVAYGYADTHYDPDKFRHYYDSLTIFFQNFFMMTDTVVEKDSVQNRIDQFFMRYTENEPFIDDFNNQVGQKNEQYYRNLKDKQYAQGWKDCEPSIGRLIELQQIVYDTKASVTDTTASGFVYTTFNSADSSFLFAEGTKGPQEDKVNALYGYSPSWNEYQRLIDVSNGTFRVSQNVLLLLIVNHLVSAIDAGILAKQHNDRLLGKVSMWDHIRLEQQAVNTGNDIAPGYAIRIKF